MRTIFCTLTTLFCLASIALAADESWPPAVEPLMRSVDLNVGESCDVKLSNGESVSVKLVDLKEICDEPRQAVRKALVTVEVNGQKTTLVAGNYRLPVTLGDVQIDCAVTKGCVQPKSNPWALEKDARLRLWPAGSPWIQPGTFQYPVNQRWFANQTQMGNEPTFVDGGDEPGRESVYYHCGLDMGGAEGQVDVLAATDGLVIISGENTIDPTDFPSVIRKQYDVVYVRDGRGWYHRYAHLQSIDPAVKPGARVKMGQKVGVLGKEANSGGWSHLHYDILGPQPSGKPGIIDGYAFLWQAYHTQHKTQLQAVARPHHLTWYREDVLLDGSLSWSSQGPEGIAAYQWMFSDGTTADGPTVAHSYADPGEYSEILKVTDTQGHVDYDFAVVLVLDREHPESLPQTIHATCWPTLGVKAGDEITFQVRSFGISQAEGQERWDFGDGTPPVEVHSVSKEVLPNGGGSNALAKDGYAITTHRYAKSGDYLASVSRTNSRGETATVRLFVRIEP
jgi:murein DD-endopeptidase MepM/ murein hydrolase activator NlpD